MTKQEQAALQLKQHELVTVRTLRKDEPMPQHLDTGFEKMPVMNDFVWVAEQKGKITGVLMASPCHGIVFFVRVRIEKGASAMTLQLLFRKCVRDCLVRGFKGYLTFIDPGLETERRFIPICQKAGGKQVLSMQVGLVGSLEKAARF